MSELDLDAIRERSQGAYAWATSSAEPPHDPVDFVPFTTRVHFENDFPALIAEVERLREEKEQMRRDLVSLTEGYEFMRALVQDYRVIDGQLTRDKRYG